MLVTESWVGQANKRVVRIFKVLDNTWNHDPLGVAPTDAIRQEKSEYLRDSKAGDSVN